MISRLLLPGFASGAPCYVFLSAMISTHPGQADHVQRTVGFPVPTEVETMSDDLAGGGFNGSDPAHTGEGGLAPQPLEVVLQLGDLCREGLVTAGNRTERELGGRCHVTGVISKAEACGHRDELLRRKAAKTVEPFLRCRHAQALDLVGGLASGLNRRLAG